MNPEIPPPQRCSGTPIETYGPYRPREGECAIQSAIAGWLRSGCDRLRLLHASCSRNTRSSSRPGRERRQQDALAKKVVHITSLWPAPQEHPPMGAAEGLWEPGDVPFILPPTSSRRDRKPRQLPGRYRCGLCRDDRCGPMRRRGRYISRKRTTIPRRRYSTASVGISSRAVPTRLPPVALPGMIQLSNGLRGTRSSQTWPSC